MDFEQAAQIGKRRRADAAVALGGYLKDKAMEVCAVRPSRNSGIDAREYEPVGEENFRELHIRVSPLGDEEAYVLLVDDSGTAKACSQRAYPVRIALQLVWAIPLPVYTGENGVLIAQITNEAMRKAQQTAQRP